MANHLLMLAQLVLQRAASLATGIDDSAQADHRPCQLLADSVTQEILLMEVPDLGQIARGIANSDAFADVGGQRRNMVTQSLKSDAIEIDGAGGGHGELRVDRAPPARGAAR